MNRTKWFDRKFAPIEDNGIFPCILERLEYTPLRIQYKVEKLSNNSMNAFSTEKWSIKKEIGHLIDLEPLWFERMLQIIKGDPNLKVADLTNRKTHDTDYDSSAMDDLINNFAAERQKMIALLRNIAPEALENVAIHPRLGTPMRLIDLAYFVAEHDDHHLAQITYLGQWNKEEWKAYDNVGIKEQDERGEKEKIAQLAEKKGKIEVAKKMKDRAMLNKDISDLTGLSEEEIESL